VIVLEAFTLFLSTMTNTTLDLRYVPHYFDKSAPQESALGLGLVLFSEWETSCGEVKITQLTEGTTNLVGATNQIHLAY